MNHALARIPSDPTQVAPRLPHPAPRVPVPRSVLFVVPFYPKDRRGSLGKHVLTPALTFSALAAVTPTSWSMRYWNESLLYKKANPLWRLLIRHRLTHAVWGPMVAASAWSRRRQARCEATPNRGNIHLEVV